MQDVLILCFFLAAVGYLSWRGYKAMNRREAGCGKGCGCASDKPHAQALGARR
ncbi:FeoB-associated Cys-rich membrane protein [Rudanella paleaurantiibacter]|uniref:FeoB-associated Cys-rich membrane protein n=1 Tax=Rudanella paleaurantiibacter TaxID=2614655 RepID=A0A7J5TV90_9BACT|nr:FeoB-associated Cys-rich membrane protein [Rudanella paleaurantiibacter]KAB7728055.1 FeoB-associated Cys-rich membrane protein [Rudanella paleaurantiibacter]